MTTQRTPTSSRRRRRTMPLLAGAVLAITGAAAASAVSAAEDPLPPDIDTTPQGGALCFGQWVTMHVPTGGGQFYGTSEDDVIMGSTGPDIIYGGDGVDRICQPQGAFTAGLLLTVPIVDDGIDVVHGDDDTDYIDGGTGNDQLYGDDGDDFVHGGEQADVLDGGYDSDILRANGGNDFVMCGAAGSTDDDTAYGGPGLDALIPSAQQADCETWIP